MCLARRATRLLHPAINSPPSKVKNSSRFVAVLHFRLGAQCCSLAPDLSPVSPLFAVPLLYEFGRYRIQSSSFFKDPLLVHVRVIRNRPVRVPAYSTNFRDRVSSFQKRRNARMLGLVKSNPAKTDPLGLLVNRFTKGIQRLPILENGSRSGGRPHGFERLWMERDPPAILPFDAGYPQLIRRFEV
jgi:hypothetical protein